MEIPQKYHGNPKEIPQEHHRNTTDILLKPHGNPIDTPLETPWNIKETPQNSHRNFTEIPQKHHSSQGEDARRIELSKRQQLQQRKGEKGFGNQHHFKKTLDTIEDNHNKHAIEDQCFSWATPLKNCLGAVFSWYFNKASYIMGNQAF